jgi:DNA polymerase-3 subunit gamma/tau
MHQGATAKPALKESGMDSHTNITTPQNLSQLIALCEDKGEMLLASSIYHYMHLVSFKNGHIECRMQESAAPNTTQQLASYLSQWTGQRWLISLSAKQGEPTLAEIDNTKKQELENRIMSEPAVAKIFELFPQAKLEAIDDEE